MIRTLLATTALAALLSSGAIAQDAAAPADPAAPATTEAPADPAAQPADPAAQPADPNAAAPAAGEAGAVTATDPVAGEEIDATDVGAQDQEAAAAQDAEPWDMSAGYVGADTDNLASRLIGQPVFSSAGDDAEEIGDITDLVFTESGQINAVVIGVGGFLGIGEKAVAVDFKALEFVLAADNTERWVLPTTADALNAAPDFVWEEDTPDDVNAEGADAMAPADPAMAPADPAMAPAEPAADPAMAPADDGEAADPAVEQPATN